MCLERWLINKQANIKKQTNPKKDKKGKKNINEIPMAIFSDGNIRKENLKRL